VILLETENWFESHHLRFIVKKFINNAEDIVFDSLKGFQEVHSKLITVHHSPCYVTRAQNSKHKKVALISGGGSGHEPLHIGMVGFGMLDAACPGHIFTSPTPQQIIAASKAVHSGKGILFLVKNYSGDRMNFEMALEELDIEHASVVVCDETVSEDATSNEYRRGIAGIVLYEKLLGALAETGADLTACLQLTQYLEGAIRSMGVALTNCTLPTISTRPSSIAENEMEIGIGIHGEPGRKCIKLTSADTIAEKLVTTISDDLGLSPGDEILLFINGMGGTPLMELYLMFNSALKICEKKGFNVTRSLVGNYVTAIDMAGCTITLCRMNPQLTSLWDHSVLTPALRWGK
jgi:phosphoenolpyruvate---glycerone phosphotransferase subunit DhaK